MKIPPSAALLIGALGLPCAGLAEEKTMIVLDGSGSMWGQIDGRAKIEIARETLGDVLAVVPAETALGMIVYGHRRKGDCSDIEVSVPAAPGSASAIAKVAQGLSPKGKTPLSAAVRLAAEELKYTEDRATVVLVTDGLETCDADPCALAAELEKTGVDFTAHVVGFDLKADERAQVACIAERTGGVYRDATDAGSLGEALRKTVAAAPPPPPEPAPKPAPALPEYNLFASARLGPESALITKADSQEVTLHWTVTERGGAEVEAEYTEQFQQALPPGAYTLSVRAGQVVRSMDLDLTAEAVSAPVIDLDAGRVTLRPYSDPAKAEVDSNINVAASDGTVRDSGYGVQSFIMPAGELTLTATREGIETSTAVTLLSGADITRDLIVALGDVLPTALYAPEGPEVTGGAIWFALFPAAEAASADRREITSGYSAGQVLSAPPGEYVLHARLGKARADSAPFTLKAGQQSAARVTLNAGVAMISAPEAYRITVLRAARDINGDRAEVDGTYGDTHEDTLPAGSYVAQVRYETDGKPVQEKPFEVRAGERVEITIP